MASVAAPATTVQTALCLIPPENLWDQIQAVRSVHDKAYPRWMPHINFIYPFVPEGNFEDIKKQLEPFINRRKPFQVQFDQSSLDYFRQRGDECTYHLRSKNSKDMIELQKLIENQLGNLIKPKRGFEAHLTLGQTTTGQISDVLSDLKAKWTTIEFTVDRVYMISRENHPENLFTIKNEILLLNQGEDESLSLGISNLTINSVKPTAMNYLWIILPNEFASSFQHLFEQLSSTASKPFRIVLAEYENGPVDSDLRSKLESTSKFILNFSPDSLGFDETTSRLFLKPTNMEVIHRLDALDSSKYDGTITLGELQKNNFDKINERFKNNWTAHMSQFQIDRIHLADINGRFKFIFRLKNS